MKKINFLALIGLLVSFATLAFAQNVSNYASQGGATWTVGGTLDIPSGGTIQLDSGYNFKNGTAAITFPTSAATLSTLGLAETITGAKTYTGGIVSQVTNDLSPTFSTGITANPVSYTSIGTCTVAAVNGGTCIPLAGVASRTISVTHFDIVATGSAATCTGVLLEDTNGTPVVIATLAAATLTSGSHNVPLTATLGAGFGAGAGLTVAKGVQIIVNGSNCTTTTVFKYAITYTIQ